MRTPRGRDVLLLSLLCLGVRGDTATLDCPSASGSESNRLKDKLLCGYDRNVRPTTDHTATVVVEGAMWLQKLEFHPEVNALQIHAFMSWGWTDQYLKWTPSDYEGLERFQLPSTDIWMPDTGLALLSYTTRSYANTADVMCRVNYTGAVQCVTPSVYTAPCVADVARWPFDSHNCSARISSLSSDVDKIDFRFRQKVDTNDYTVNRNWELLEIQTNKISGLHPEFSISFALKRHSGGASSIVVIPAGVLATLTLVAFWLEPESAERLCLISLDILCHCLFLQYLALTLPSNGEKIANILLFFRDSLLLAGASLVISLLVRRMQDVSRPPPAWATALARSVQDTLPGQILLCGDTKDAATPSDAEDGAPLVDRTASAGTWRLLGTLLDRIAFLVFFLTLFALLCAYIP